VNTKATVACINSWKKSPIGSVGAALEKAAAKIEAQSK
jgi:hypothetical protein